MANTAYIAEYQKRKRREKKIEKLKGDIQSLKGYIRKVQNRSGFRKFTISSLRNRLKEEAIKTKRLSYFIDKPLDARVHNVADLLMRAHKTIEQLKGEINYGEITLLLYLYNLESASSIKAARDMSKDPRTISALVFDLSSKGLVVSNRIGNSNYIYLTPEGKAAVKNFLELLKKQQTKIL